jgi:hypothetical protein
MLYMLLWMAWFPTLYGPFCSLCYRFCVEMWEGEVTTGELNNGGKSCKPSFPFQLCINVCIQEELLFAWKWVKDIFCQRLIRQGELDSNTTTKLKYIYIYMGHSTIPTLFLWVWYPLNWYHQI